MFTDVLTTGLEIAKQYDLKQAFTLYQQYDRKDVCRLLNWPLDVSAPLYGYRVAEDVCPIFITYHKDAEEKRNAIYNNQLQDGRSLRWYTRTPRHLSSDEVQRLLAGVKEGKPQVKVTLICQTERCGWQGILHYLGPAYIQPGLRKRRISWAKEKSGE